jgi:hypothetical protein
VLQNRLGDFVKYIGYINSHFSSKQWNLFCVG